MRELLSRVWKKEEGFSLIELIIVIAILAIIAAIAVPNLVENLNNSREGVDKTSGKMIADAVMQEIALKEYDSASVPATSLDWAVVATAGNPDVAAADAFEVSIINKLNQGMPEVKRYSTGKFTADITFQGTDVLVEVFVVETDGTSHEVFPVPDGDYAD